MYKRRVVLSYGQGGSVRRFRYDVRATVELVAFRNGIYPGY